MGIRERELLFDGTVETASGGRNDAASKLLVEVVVCVHARVWYGVGCDNLSLAKANLNYVC